MWTSLALFAVPSLCLLDLSVAYALVSPSCSHQTSAWLHAIYGASVALCVLLTCKAWPRGERRPRGLPDGDGDPATRQRFVTSIAGPTALFFTLVTLAQWMAVWLLSPCHF